MAMTGGKEVLLKTGYPNYGAETSFPLRLYLYYKIVSQDKTTAVTTMSLGMYFTCPDEWYVGPWSDYGSYLGTTSNTFAKSVPSNFRGTLWLAENITFKVQHDEQGKGTAKIAWKWGVDSSYGQFEFPSGIYSVTLEDIPRASSVSVSEAVNAGSALTINVSRASSTFTHTLRYIIGNASGTIATDVDTSYSWTVPYDILKQFPSATSGIGTIYCDTYNGSTKLGTSSCGVTVKAPDNETTKPEATMALSPSGNVPAVFSGMFIQGKTAVKADFEAESAYSTIKSFALTVSGKTTNGDPATSALLTTSGKATVTGTVTDARGFARVLTQDIPVHAYSAPSVAVGSGQTSVVCERATSDGITAPAGTYLRIVAKRKYSSVDGKNKCVLRYRYKISAASSYGAWQTLVAEGDANDEYNGVISGVVSDLTISYDIQIGVADTMGSETISSHHVPTDKVTFHLSEGGKGAAFFGYAEEDGVLSMSGHRISNIAAPVNDGDAVPKFSLLDLIYPVGSIYLAFSSVSPETLFGGKWARIENRFLWACDDTGTIGIEGGESSHTLTADELPAHSHYMYNENANGESTNYAIAYDASKKGYAGTLKTQPSGGGAAHNNMPPYIQIAAWRRTA